MGPSLGGLAIGLLVLGIGFGLVERLWPAVPWQRRWRRGTGTDLAYWFFTPLVTRGLSRVLVVASVVAVAIVVGAPVDAGSLRELASGHGALRRQPVALQALQVVVLGDLVGYWSHRLFHGRRLWPFHAVHHSSTEVDWLSSVRLHPVNDALTRVAQALPFLALGFSPAVVAAYVPFLTLHALLLHANVGWTFGPLRHVVSSPTFHRWHHTCQWEGLDRNFAGLLPVWDRLFGTLYMPDGRRPERFGIDGSDVPEGLMGQLAYPFRRRRREGGAQEPGRDLRSMSRAASP